MYEIHPANLETLKEKLAAMQRRARKLNTNPITITEHGTKMVEVTRQMPGGKVVKFEEPRILMTVEGHTPKFEGWSLVAKISLVGEERLASCVPGETCPEQYRTGGFDCDHCGYNRQRKETFVLRHEDGTHKQVGRNCICDFLGGKSPEELLAEAEYIFAAMGVVDSDEYRGCGGYADAVGVLEYLCAVAICIRRLGWVSRSAAGCDESSTSSDAWNLLNPPLDAKGLRWHAQWVEANNLEYQDRDRDQAAEALEWAKSQPVEGVSDYLYNLGVTCRASYATHKTLGLVASAIVAHAKHLERAEEINRRRREDAKKTREHVGEVKKREVFAGLTVQRMRYIEGDYGTTTLVIFENESGDILKWFASKDLDDLHEGDTVDLKATVKKHDSYNGVKETIVTRGVVAA